MDDSGESGAVAERLESIEEKIKREELQLSDYEDSMDAVAELAPLFGHDRSYFVLGNYDREPIRRLNLVVDRLNRRTDAYAFRMVDIRGEWDNSLQKFYVIGTLVSYIVGVAEREPSDFLVEQGMLVGTEEFFEKSHVLQREYPNTDEENPYGWMQDGVFELLDREGRLYTWRTEDDLTDVTEELP